MEEKQKGYLLGIVGALIGGLIGTIPWIVLYVYANMIYSLLAFIVAMAALKGYELFKGKVDKKLPYIIGAISIICITIATLVIIPNLLLVKEIGTTSIANFKLLYADSEFAGEIIGDYIMSLFPFGTNHSLLVLGLSRCSGISSFPEKTLYTWYVPMLKSRYRNLEELWMMYLQTT